MNAAEMLAWLKKQASDEHVSLDRQYIRTLREAFCRVHALSAHQYGNWIASVTGGAITVEASEISTYGTVKSEDIPILLNLGDTCALDQAGTGSYYTPDTVARFMMENALHQTLDSRFPESSGLTSRFFKGDSLSSEDALVLQKLLRSLRIVDLACGNGVFLRAGIACYLRVAKFSGEDASGLGFVAHSLCALDIRRDALESWAISLGGGVQAGPDAVLPLKLHCISSVEGDDMLRIPWVAEVMEDGGFDLVIGNPPYLGEKGNKEVFSKLREHPFGQRYYEGRMDLFYYFLHRGVDILKPGGILCQLTTSYYSTADFASKLRAHLHQSGGITGLVSFNDQRVFTGAMGHHLILFYQKAATDGKAQVIVYNGSLSLKKYNFEDLDFRKNGTHYQTVVIEDRKRLFDEYGHIVLNPARWETDRLQRLIHACPDSLKTVLRINQGIVSGADKAGGQGVFVLEPEECFPEAEPWLVPWYKNGDIRRYRARETTERRLLYIGNERENLLPSKLLAHFEPHREKLSRRRECLTGARPWYGLQWPRERGIFQGPKLVAPQRCSENRFAYVEGPWFASADVYFLSQPAEGISLWALLAYLNSDLIGQWFQSYGKRKGTQLELYATPLGKVPVNREWFSPQGQLHALGKQLYEASGLNGDRLCSLRREVDDWLNRRLESVK